MSMMTWTRRMSAVMACLAAGMQLGALPILADPSAGAAQTLALQHTVPGDILKFLHWDQPANWPPGVTRITAKPETNSLTVTATPAGFANVKEVVRLLDIAPRQVKIRFVLARATPADLQASGLHGFTLIPATVGTPGSAAPTSYLGMASGATATHLLTILTQRRAILQAPTITTTNNVDASISISGASSGAGGETFQFAAAPRVNSNHTVTLRLHPSLSRRVGGTTLVTQEMRTLRTVPTGETIVLMNVFSQAAGDKNLLLFVTPTVLPEENHLPARKAR